MTIQDALDDLDKMMPNAISREDKVRWLATLDGKVWNEVIMTHEPMRNRCVRPDVRHDYRDPLSMGDVRKPQADVMEDIVEDYLAHQEQIFKRYDDATPLGTELLIPEPYTDTYRFYLCAQVCLVNRELQEYNNYAALYNGEYDQYKAWYNRTHMPRGRVRGFRL